jgi:antitoxin component YwqK of YwqJK toxin-antitoxin module
MIKYLKTILFVIVILSGVEAFTQTKNQTDDKGLKQGYWEKIDPKTGKISYKGAFKNDKPQGIFLYYFKGMDSLHSKSDFRQDGKIAYVTMYHLKTGKIQAKGKYVNEEKDSLWNFYYEWGDLLSTEIYVKGKKDGPSKVFNEKGGISEEKSYKNNLLEGAFKMYYNDKKVKAEGAYLKDEYEGKCSWYYPNGVAAAQGFYEKGIKKGVWLYKEQSGKIKDKEVWQNGKQLNQKEMDAYFKSKNITFPEEKKTTTQQAPPQKTNSSTRQESHE